VTSPDPPDRADSNADNVLDPVAGHGTFIAGLVELAAPGARMRLPRVVRFRGDTDVPTFLNAAIAELSTLIDPADLALTRRRLERTVLGMSFSGALSDVEISVARQGLNLFRRLGIVAVASAGNNSSCEPLYPAAFGDPTDSERLANVVSVGALGRCGPATFTNYGCWVRACAAGEMLTSSFFTYDEPWGGFRQFDGWAQWSGTSFSVGIVIGSFLREMRLTGSTAADAVKRLVDAPDLPAIHNLGTIVT
jgi:subtilisin family serine protease